jgi:hypothetical protein
MKYRVYKKNGAVSTVNKKFISHLPRAHPTPSAAATAQVSHALPELASLTYCGATGPVSKMASQQENAFCELRFEVSRSVITVQREFCAQSRDVWGCSPPLPHPETLIVKLILLMFEYMFFKINEILIWKCRLICNSIYTGNFDHIQVSQKERSVFWEVIVSVIVNKKLCTNMFPIPNGFQDRAGIYCSSDRVGTVYSKCSKIPPSTPMQLTLHTDSHASDSGVAGREGRTLLSAQDNPLCSQMALSRKPFGIGHMFIQSFMLRMTVTMTSQNIDISFWDTCILRISKDSNSWIAEIATMTQILYPYTLEDYCLDTKGGHRV